MARASGAGDTWASKPSVGTLGGEQAAVERLGAVDLGRHGELRLDALGAHAGHGLGLLGVLDHAEDDAGEGSDVARGKEIARVLVGDELGIALEDRKSTRLNSSHPSNSYAVCCLKKKKRQVRLPRGRRRCRARTAVRRAAGRARRTSKHLVL